MIALIQRVSEASVSVEQEVVGRIGSGLLALVAVQPDDTEASVERMVERIATYRVFPDADDRMNESLLDQGLELLAVSQFTLAAATRKGRRPSFHRAAPPEIAVPIYEHFIARLRRRGLTVGEGVFQAMMEIELVNDGPVTVLLDPPRGRGEA